MDNKTFDEFHYHEIMAIADFLVRAIDDLSKYDVIADDPEMTKHVEAAGEAMADLYQSAGASQDYLLCMKDIENANK